MKHIIRFTVLCSAVLLSAVSNSVEVIAVGEQIGNVLIAQIEPASAGSASDEYVELYNPNIAPVDITGWQIQYRSSSHTNIDASGWATKATIGCGMASGSGCSAMQTAIDAGATLRLSSVENEPGALPLTSGMATTGGEVRLVKPKTNSTPESVQDMVGYGAALGYEGSHAAPTPGAGRSIGRIQSATASYIDSNDNGNDFVLAAPPQDNSGPGGQASDSTGATGPFLDPEITEVFPDPASPLLDSADEFIELYNPYDEPLNLNGYTLKAGSAWTHKYVIHDQTIAPHGYLAFKSSLTHIQLSNSGSGVRLYDPSGAMLVDVPSYGKARSGASWAHNTDGLWVWSTIPTPGSQNIISEPADASLGSAKASTAASKKTAAKSSSTSSKSKKPSTSKSGTGSVLGATTNAADAAPGQGGGISPWVVAAVGAVAVGYIAYEYRQDIGGLLHRKWEVLKRVRK